MILWICILTQHWFLTLSPIKWTLPSIFGLEKDENIGSNRVLDKNWKWNGKCSRDKS